MRNDPSGLNDSVTVYGWPDDISYNYVAYFFWGDPAQSKQRPPSGRVKFFV